MQDVLTSGVTLFVDLTEEGELEPYEELVPRSARYLRFPIRDFTVPDPSTLTSVLDAIDAEIEAGGIPYVHCWAGCGRTGVVVGCWLVRHGTERNEALDRIARRHGVPDVHRPSSNGWRFSTGHLRPEPRQVPETSDHGHRASTDTRP